MDSKNQTSLLLLFIISLVWMAVVAIWYFNYPFPNGKEGTLLGFIVIFFRELLILSTGLIIVAYITFKKIRNNKGNQESD